MPSESVGYYAEARDTWKPSQGEQQRLTVKEAERARQSKQADLKHEKAKVRPSPSARMPWAEFSETYLAEIQAKWDEEHKPKKGFLRRLKFWR